MAAPTTPAMPFRHLGHTGLKVSVLSLGSWITYGGQVDDETAFQCIKTAFEHGVNTIDTAEVYASGKSEESVGKALERLGLDRSEYVIMTKLFWGGKGPNQRGLSRKHIIEGINASLARLRLKSVDVVFAHRPDVDTPMEEIVRAFNFLLDQGLIYYWGTSEWSAQQITEAHLVAQRLNLVGPACEQPEYNMFTRERFEKEYDPLYKHFGLGTTIWSPLASGVLTGKYLEGIPDDSRFAIQNNPLIQRIRGTLETEEGKKRLDKVRKLSAIATRIGASMAQLALAWCVKNNHVSTVILGASKPQQVVENIQSLAFVDKLDDATMLEIETILANKPVPVMNFRNF